MNNLRYLFMSFIAICLLLAPAFALAKGEDSMNSNLEKFTGVIKEVKNKEDNVILTVETEQKEPLVTIFTISDATLLFNSGTTEEMKKKEFLKGQRIEAYYDKAIPRIMIYPAQITPELVIVQDSKHAGNVKVGLFDDKLISEDNQLKLNITKDTIVVNKHGERLVEKNLVGNELLVFYRDLHGFV